MVVPVNPTPYRAVGVQYVHACHRGETPGSLDTPPDLCDDPDVISFFDQITKKAVRDCNPRNGGNTMVPTRHALRNAARACGVALLASLPTLAPNVALAAAPGTPKLVNAMPPGDARHEAWRSTITAAPAPADGCFKASYPSTTWSRVACSEAPKRPFLPRSGRRSFTVGDGDDYTAAVTGLIGTGVGSFPKITGLKSETGSLGANDYSLQLNSQFFASPACKGAAQPASCLGWEQFVYSSGYGQVYMQYWLINYNARCPSGWNSYSGDCYTNSNAVDAPDFAATQLKHLKITGKVVANGTDTLTLSSTGDAYTTTGKDSVVTLAKYWNAAEYNVIGDGDGSEADFNSGTKITVEIALTDGLTTAPTCDADSGTTGETNNLTLGSCAGTGGSTPSIKFTESN
jgi:hypothetical protein